jgi:hypothetical protein
MNEPDYNREMPTMAQLDDYLEHVTQVMRESRPRMAIIGPPSARALISSIGPAPYIRKIAGNGHQRRRVRRFFTRQYNMIRALSEIPGDNGQRLMITARYPL